MKEGGLPKLIIIIPHVFFNVTYEVHLGGVSVECLVLQVM